MKERFYTGLIYAGIMIALIGFGLIGYLIWYGEWGPGRVERELHYGNPGPELGRVTAICLPSGIILILVGGLLFAVGAAKIGKSEFS